MGADTSIEWTNSSWNPIRGCSRVDDDCINCYAEGVAARFSGIHPKTGKPLAYHGLARRSSKGLPLWTGEVRMVPEHFADPIRWRRPRRIFVNSMSDLFHEKLTNEQIASVFGVMAAAPQHTFQVLTKRAKRMHEWFKWVEEQEKPKDTPERISGPIAACALAALRTVNVGKMFLQAATDPVGRTIARVGAMAPAWPLPNVHLGVSMGFQRAADERMVYLMASPAAVRWISAEPLIGPIDLTNVALPNGGQYDALRGIGSRPSPLTGVPIEVNDARLDWVVVGGESGPRARECDVQWIRAIVEQCRDAEIPAFVKQLGAKPLHLGAWPNLKDGHGGDIDEWPTYLRVREWPEEIDRRDC